MEAARRRSVQANLADRPGCSPMNQRALEERGLLPNKVRIELKQGEPVIEKKTTRLALSVALLSVCFAWPAAAAPAATVTFLQGAVDYRPSDGHPWQPLQHRTPVGAGHSIRTGSDGYVELTLPDSSILRLAPETVFRIDTSLLPKNRPRRFSARLLLGKLWARVAGSLGISGGSFRIATATAVAGVRGTTYDLRSAETRGTDIWVYEGVVAVGPAAFEKGGPKEEIDWPGEVSERQWEEILLGKLQKLHIGPDGKPGTATPFEPDKEKDDWTAFNLARDRAGR